MMTILIWSAAWFVCTLLLIAARRMRCTRSDRLTLEREQLAFVDELFRSMNITDEEIREIEKIEYTN